MKRTSKLSEFMGQILAVVLWLLRDDRVVTLGELCSVLNGQVSQKQLSEEVIKPLANANACEIDGEDH